VHCPPAGPKEGRKREKEGKGKAREASRSASQPTRERHSSPITRHPSLTHSLARSQTPPEERHGFPSPRPFPRHLGTLLLSAARFLTGAGGREERAKHGHTHHRQTCRQTDRQTVPLSGLSRSYSCIPSTVVCLIKHDFIRLCATHSSGPRDCPAVKDRRRLV
jgi:hypothetical protein